MVEKLTDASLQDFIDILEPELVDIADWVTDINIVRGWTELHDLLYVVDVQALYELLKEVKEYRQKAKEQTDHFNKEIERGKNLLPPNALPVLDKFNYPL